MVGLTDPDEFSRVVAAAAVAFPDILKLPKVKDPPSAEDVPPPTKEAVRAAFVISATSTSVSMVTV
jgi:hypothetical protein